MSQSNQSNAQAWSNASEVIRNTIQTTLEGVDKEVSQRTYRASNELRNSALYVLRGERSGRKYTMPHTGRTAIGKKSGKPYTVPNSGVKYRASAPGEPPAVRTGVFRLSWGTSVKATKSGRLYSVTAAIESSERVNGNLLGELLENGHGNTAPRPYKQAVIDRALPKIEQIYSRSYC